MKRPHLSFSRVALLAFGFVTAMGLTVLTTGQEPQDQPDRTDKISVGNFQITGLPDDWTHHHLVISNPGTEEDALDNDTHDRWLKVTRDPRYVIQQLKRGAPVQGVAADHVARIELAARDWKEAHADAPSATEDMMLPELISPISPEGTKRGKANIKKDWSAGLDGTAATGTGTVGTLSSSSISGSSSITIGSTTLTASAPTPASQTGSFTGNPTNGQTVTIGGSEVLTASLGTAATATITIGSSFCFAPSQGVTVNGTSLTTNATQGTGTFVVGTVPSGGEQVVIGGVTYTFETTLSGTTPLNQVLVPGSNSSTNRTHTAENLSVAINNSGSCGSTQVVNTQSVCTLNVSAANSVVSSTDNSSATQTLTSLCADNAAITGTSDGSKVTVNQVAAASSAGTNTTTTFALNTSGSATTPASQSLTAQNIEAAVNTNSTTSGIVTATNPSTGVVTLTATTWGTAGDSYTLTTTATNGVTLGTFSSLNTGTNGTNTGTSFAIDNVNADAATNLAAAIGRNGGTVGVTANSAGAVVTVTASTAGTGGDSIALAEGLSNFTWSGSSLANGSDGVLSGTTFPYWSVNNYVAQAVLASKIATAINMNTTLVAPSGVTASSNSNVVTVVANSGGTNSTATTASSFSAFGWGHSSLQNGAAGTGQVQPNAFPAKYGVSLTQASCNDYVIYPTGQAGLANTPNIIAYNNLYTTGCSGSVPSFYWGYNTGGTVTTSPVLSMDGSQVAFIQVASSEASLVVLKWAPGPTTTPATQTSSSYRSCTAPCMYAMPLSGTATPNDTFSAPYADYNTDTIYVGDDSGNLHKFTGVFMGNPAEVGSPWPVNLGSSPLASPVYDPTWYGGQAFVGDLGGGLHCVEPSGTTGVSGPSGSCESTSISGGQIADAPLVDSNANYLLAFVNTSSSNIVYGYGEQYFPTTPGTVGVGTGATGHYLYAGAYDNVYWQSGDQTGNVYVVGNTGATTGASLYRVGLEKTLTGAVTAVVTSLTPNATSAYPWPSPVTEFCNPGTAAACALNSGGTATTTGTDYVFFSVNRGNKTGCTNTATNGCVLAYNVSTPTSISEAGSGLNLTTPGTYGCWATGAMVIDNGVPTGNLAGASQIYFVGLNGASSAATGTGCTSGTANLNGTQASQSSP